MFINPIALDRTDVGWRVGMIEARRMDIDRGPPRRPLKAAAALRVEGSRGHSEWQHVAAAP